VGTESFRG